jgi:DNA repair protein RadC
MARLPSPRPGPRWGPKRVTNLGSTKAERVCSKVGEDQAIQVCVTKPRKPMQIVVSDAPAVCALLRGARYRDRESFFTVSLDTHNRVLGVEEVARGSAGSVEIHPREVFKAPILLGASAVIVAHNHPSGIVAPSNDDAVLTERLVKVGRDVGVPVLDHLIVGGETACYSFGERRPDLLMGARRGRKPKRRRRR